MRLINLIGAPILLFGLVRFSTNPKVLSEVNLSYRDSSFYLEFKQFEERLSRFEAFIDADKFYEINNVDDLNMIKLPPLGVTAHTFEIKYELNSKIHSINFNTKPITDCDFNQDGFFSLNSIIDDYQNRMTFKKGLTVQVIDYAKEVFTSKNYIELDQVGSFEFDTSVLLAEDIEYVIYTKDLFKNLDYQQGYHFDLDLLIQEEGNILDFSSLNSSIINHQLFLPREGKDKIIEGRIYFHRVFETPIDLYLDYNVEVVSYLFGENGNYQMEIKDKK